jgi:aminoglycoside phosphotransferase (APT) family kinase protein
VNIGPKIGEGHTAEIFFRDNRLAVKLFRPGIPVQLAEAEWLAAQHVTRLVLPAPAARAREEWQGRPAIVYDYVTGIPLLTHILRSPWRLRRHARQLAVLHRDVHTHGGTGLPPQKAVLEHQIRSAPLLTDRQKAAVLARLSQLPDGAVTCHGDLHPDNILLTPDGPVILDWLTAHCGDPLADVARTVLMLRTGSLPGELPRPLQSLLQIVRRRFCRFYLHEYLRLADGTVEQVTAWELPVAAARLAEHVPEAEKQQLLLRVRTLLRWGAAD